MSEISASSLNDDYQPISALNDLLYCERRCALHRLEGVWTDNAYTLEGTLSHRRADLRVSWESAPGVAEVHGMWLRSDRLRIVGKADIVEFHAQAQASSLPNPVGQASSLPNPVGQASSLPTRVEPSASPGPPQIPTTPAATVGRLEACPTVPYPVEYKRGKRRKWDNDDVQVCAQALCLEEMLGVAVPRGAIFHIRSKRRREVLFTDKLRRTTEDAVTRLHELIASRQTPPAVHKPQCDGCSLRQVCLPEALGRLTHIQNYVSELFRP